MGENADKGTFTLRTLAGRGARHYWRTNLAVVVGCAIAVAVLTGSLLVGESMRGSLRVLALKRLGNVTHALIAPRFIHELTSDRIVCSESGAAPSSTGSILLRGTVREPNAGATVPEVNLLGVDERFWSMQDSPPMELDGRQVAVNRILADDLGVAEGDSVIVALGRSSNVKTNTIFSPRARADTMRTFRCVLAKVLPARGVGLFSLRQGETRPRNVYLSLAWLQEQLGRKGRMNAVLAHVKSAPERRGMRRGEPTPSLVLRANMGNLGLRLVPNREHGYVSLESDDLLLPEWAHERARGAAHAVAGRQGPAAKYRAEPMSIYLANSLVRASEGDSGAVPYSVVAAWTDTGNGLLGSFDFIEGGLVGDRVDGILLNKWAADDLGAKFRDRIEMTYYVAGEGGALREETRVFTLTGIVAMRGAAVDPGLVPAFEGITDADGMRDWNPPFPIDLKRIRSQDEEYWRKYSTSPKAYLHADVIKELWKPYGGITSIRIAVEGMGPEALAASLRPHLEAELPQLGFSPVRKQALEAAEGSSDFGVLFLSMSMFLVAAAAGMVGLLLRLTVERRAAQFGILLATGFTAGQAAAVLRREGFVLAVLGTALGVPLGIGYAWLIILALRTLWAGAVGGFALTLHVGPVSLLIGALAGLLVSLVAITWAARLMKRTPPLTLLAGWQALEIAPARDGRIATMIGLAAVGIAAVLLDVALVSEALPDTVAFFGGGSFLLVGILALLYGHLWRRRGRRGRRGRSIPGRVSIFLLGWRGIARNRGRSLLTAGLLACASFVIVAVAANRRDLQRVDVSRLDSGAGGFSLIATLAVPIHVDLNTKAGRDALGLDEETERILSRVEIYSCRVSDGDDVSCLNMNRPQRPRVLGVPKSLIERGGFSFAKTQPGTRSWAVLESQRTPISSGNAIPAIADAASARWIMKVGFGEEIEIDEPGVSPTRLKLVGLLANSIFQGEVLISGEDFLGESRADSGYRYFLIDCRDASPDAVAVALRKDLGDLGIDVRRTAAVLAGYAGVQNTYLRAFQTLGGLGLLLGTFGLVVVLLRSVVERRRELAMMLALGLRRRQIVAIMLIENGALLVLGLVIGSATALIAVAPHLASALAEVNWGALAGTLGACLAVGLTACIAAAVASVRGELLPALRSE